MINQSVREEERGVLFRLGATNVTVGNNARIGIRCDNIAFHIQAKPGITMSINFFMNILIKTVEDHRYMIT